MDFGLTKADQDETLFLAVKVSFGVAHDRVGN